MAIENIMTIDWWWADVERESELEDDHIVMVHADGTPVYEDGYGPDEYGDIVYYCDICDSCEECPKYGYDCDGKGE